MSTQRPNTPLPGPRSETPLPGTTPQARPDRPLTAGTVPQPPQQPGPADAGREVAGHARSEIEDVTSHAVEEAKSVAETAKSEVRDVVDEARDAVRQQADRQSHVAAEALGRVRDDLQAMARNESPRDSTAEYLQRAARSLDGVVERLERDGVEGALSGIRTFAQRSPGSFLLAPAGAGFALGRILRNGDHPQQVREEQVSTASGSTPASASTPTYRSATAPREIDLTADPTRPLPADDAQDRSFADRGLRS